MKYDRPVESDDEKKMPRRRSVGVPQMLTYLDKKKGRNHDYMIHNNNSNISRSQHFARNLCVSDVRL